MSDEDDSIPDTYFNSEQPKQKQKRQRRAKNTNSSDGASKSNTSSFNYTTSSSSHGLSILSLGESEERVARQFSTPAFDGRNGLSTSRSCHSSSSSSYEGESEERVASLEIGSDASDSMPNRLVTPVLVPQRVELPSNVMKVDNNEKAKLQAFLICLAGNEVTSSNVGKKESDLEPAMLERYKNWESRLSSDYPMLFRPSIYTLDVLLMNEKSRVEQSRVE